MAVKIITRKIRFYHLRITQPTLMNPSSQLDMLSVLKFIKGLDFQTGTGPTNNYWRDPQGGKLYGCWIDQTADECCHIRFGKLRRDDMPQVEQAGAISPLDLPQNANLAEIMHLVLFPSGIIGAEHNYYGPRMQHFIRYLMNKTMECPQITADLLLKHDAAEQLEKLEGITFLRLRIHTPYIQVIQSVNTSLANAFLATKTAGDPDIIEIVMQNKGKNPLLNGMKLAMQSLFRRDDFAEEIDKAEVIGLGEDDEEVDILSDKFVISQDFKRKSPTSKEIDQNEMYTAIESGYDQLKDELAQAVGAMLR